jgi:hypothetical protein
MDVQMVVATNWDGWARDVRFSGNAFNVAGTARYGREAGRSGPDYLIQPGFAPAQAIRFSGNAYLGRHIDLPPDDAAQIVPSYVEPQADWAVPTFDPAKPEGFSDYLIRHRSWMLTMLQRELGAPPAFLQARRTGFLDARR